jgi:hypothetical protein
LAPTLSSPSKGEGEGKVHFHSSWYLTKAGRFNTDNRPGFKTGGREPSRVPGRRNRAPAILCYSHRHIFRHPGNPFWDREPRHCANDFPSRHSIWPFVPESDSPGCRQDSWHFLQTHSPARRQPPHQPWPQLPIQPREFLFCLTCQGPPLVDLIAWIFY